MNIKKSFRRPLAFAIFTIAFSIPVLAQDDHGATDAAATGTVAAQYIQTDANGEPLCRVGFTVEQLEQAVGELETVFETDAFLLLAAGDYTYKLVDGRVVSQTIQIADEADDKAAYNQILDALSRTTFIRDSHNTGGNFYQYANFQIQFDDFQGYQKLTFQANPDNDLTEK